MALATALQTIIEIDLKILHGWLWGGGRQAGGGRRWQGEGGREGETTFETIHVSNEEITKRHKV